MQKLIQLLPLLAALSSSATAAASTPYKKTWSYNGKQDIGTKFNFNDAADPSGGHVEYVSASKAKSLGLVKNTKGGTVKIGADSKTQLSGTDPRSSFRLESKEYFGEGLLIADFEHIPASACGSWPAFWMLGKEPPAWPTNGEIDIIEGVNMQPYNQMSLHTTEGCVVTPTGYTGITGMTDCSSTPDDNDGCYVTARTANTYGTGFNKAGGGIYAMQLTGNQISIWHFLKGNIPVDIKKGKPDPSKWDKPAALFHGQGCDVASHFNKLQLIMNVDFCGGWVSSNLHGCSDKFTDEASCEAFVAANPNAFAGSYFEINDISYYTRTEGTDPDASYLNDPTKPGKKGQKAYKLGGMGGGPPTNGTSGGSD